MADYITSYYTTLSDKDKQTYHSFRDQAEKLGITVKSNFKEILPYMVNMYKQEGTNPNFTTVAMKNFYDQLGFFKKAGVQAIAPGESPAYDVMSKQTIETLQDPKWRAENIGKILSQGENLGAKNNKTGVYGGVPQLLGLSDKIGGTTTQDLSGFFSGLGGLLGVGGGDIENIKQAVDKIDDKEIPWT